MAKTRKAAIGFIFITLLIDITGLGLIIPVVPKLIQELTGEGISQASAYGGWLTFTFAIMQFLFSPVLGGLSDQYGRRPVLLARTGTRRGLWLGSRDSRASATPSMTPSVFTDATPSSTAPGRVRRA